MKFFLKIIAVIIPCIIFSACTKDSIVEPPPPDPGLDTASYYNWQKIEASANFGDVFVNDTNNVWIYEPYGPVIYNGTDFVFLKPSDSRFVFYKLDVIDKNNSFWSGSLVVSETVNYPALIKYTNGSQEIIIIDSSTNNIPATEVLAISPTQAWIGLWPYNYVYFYDNGLITKYDVGQHNNPQIKKWNNSIYYFGSIYSDSIITTFKFNGSDFDSLSSYPIAVKGNVGLTEYIFKCGNDLINLNSQYGTYLFNGNQWSLHSVFSTNGFFGAWKVGGVSKDSLSLFSAFPYDIYSWKGAKWRKQNNFAGLIGNNGLNSRYSNIINYKGKLFFSVNIREGISSYSYLVVGRPKN